MKFYSFVFLLFIISIDVTAQSDWELQRDKSEIKVWTRDQPDSNFKQFKAETELKASLENVVAVFLDIENMNRWYDRVEKVELVKKVSDKEGIYKIDFELPWPVANRVSAVRAIITYDLSANTVWVRTNYEPNIITNTDDLLVTEIRSEWKLTSVEGEFVHIYHEGYMNPAGSLPAWIANSGVKDGPVKTLKALKRILSEYRDVQVEFLVD